MKYATSDATGEGDVLREDWSGQRAAVSGARKSAKPVGAIIINYNAIRKELGDEWEVSFASRLLNSIKMPNLRSIMLHAGVQEASADNSNVPVLLLDATWSAKSDAPGQCLREELTLDKVPTKRSPAFIPGAELQVSIRPTYRAVADWVFKAYLSDIASNEEVAGKVYQSWKYWLGDHRAVLNKVTENLGSWCVLALSRLSDANSPPVVHFRSTMRSGMGSESAIEGLELLCKPVDIAVSKVPEHPDVWSVPVKSAFVQGSIGWANARSFGMPVIVGNIAMGDFDLVASVRDDVEHADGVQPVSTRPAPKPAPGGSTGASPGTPPASKPPSK